MKINCKICDKPTFKLFTADILFKYSTKYHQCQNCEFIQTDNPFWLEESYSSAISKLDIGLISRNIYLSNIVEKLLIENFFDPNGKFVDYGGGLGMFVRIMRDKGFDYYRQDLYCNNQFSEFFDISDLDNKACNFELLTAFEVFEHLVDPFSEIEKMLTLSENILFSTELIPQNTTFKSSEDWWYFVPEGGQHISFYTLKSLKIIASKYNLHLYSNNANLHLFTKKKLSKDPFSHPKVKLKTPKLFGFIKELKIKRDTLSSCRESLLTKDFEFVRKKLNKKT